MKKIACTRSIWTGRKQVRVRGTRQPIYPGKVTLYERWTDGTKVVSVFHSGRLWWLSYGYRLNTGAFKSKKAAIHFWSHGGR